jgi:endogenous inhibitor of DNA gyrase (YacG/DUF329 family)
MGVEEPSAFVAMSENEWSEAVAAEMGLQEPGDVERVSSVLLDNGIRPGRPRSPHRLRVLAVYFSGLKHVKITAEVGGHTQDDVPTTTVPFAFAHEFSDGFTAFATDHVNDAGKSTVLGVILWALHGVAPVPTLQADVRSKWLREAAVLFDVDGVVHQTSWRVAGGVPMGGIYTLASLTDVNLAQLRIAGIAAATLEGETTLVGDDTQPKAVEDVGIGTGVVPKGDAEIVWPASELVAELVANGQATPATTFENAEEFEAAVGNVMLDRLDLEPVLVYAKNPGALDASDGKVIQHGWGALSQALSIIDPTAPTVLGEDSILIQHLMGVFLGSGWSHPTATAHRHLKKADGELAARRRRREVDRDGNQREIDEMKDQLAALNLRISEYGDVPPFDFVMETTGRANSDALAASQAYRRMLSAAAEWGEAERTHATAERDLFALTEALATKRFFHSLRPSCCPRCDAQIDIDKWAREKEGHCSLCDSEFLGSQAEDNGAESGSDLEQPIADHQPDEEEDQIMALREQVTQLAARAGELSSLHDIAGDERERLAGIAASSENELAALDRSVSEERYNVERQIARLEGRIAEREMLNVGAEGDRDSARAEFMRSVFAAAKKLAAAKKDDEQRETLRLVSEVLTELGFEFGIRNLEKATLRANGHLPVIKGGHEEKFGGLNAGERLRLKIALIVGLLRAGAQTGRGRHPGLLVVDDLTTHEINPDDAAKIAQSLSAIEGLQFLTASTLGPMLIDVVGSERVVMPVDGEVVLF